MAPNTVTSSSSDGLDIEKQPGREYEQRQQQHDDGEKQDESLHGPLSSEYTGSELGDQQIQDAGNYDDENDRPTVLDRVLSRVTSRSSIDPGPPPDGGLRAWCVCLAAHLVTTNTWGWINSFGVFQAYYTHLLDRPSSDISWIGSITVFLLFFVGTLTGRLVDAGFFRIVFATGTVLQVAGIFATSFCTTYWQFLLAQGLCMGFAAGCMFCPLMAILSTYFLRRRALVLGISACGSATGGLIFPSMVRQLLPKVGFPWTIRAIGFIQMAILIVTHVLVKPRIKPRKTGQIIDLSAFKELEYTFYALGAFFCFWGVYFAFYYLAAFARDGIDDPLSYSSSLDLLLILNGVGVTGRLVPNYFADRVGAVNVFIPNAIAGSVIVFGWMAVHETSGLYAWSVIYGTVASGIQSLFPAGVTCLTTDLNKIGVRLGMTFTIVSFAALTGPPIAGAIIDASDGGYKGAQAFAGSVIAVGAGFLTAAKIVRNRKMGEGWRGKV